MFCDRIAYLANKIKVTGIIYKIMFDVPITVNTCIAAICFNKDFCKKYKKY